MPVLTGHLHANSRPPIRSGVTQGSRVTTGPPVGAGGEALEERGFYLDIRNVGRVYLNSGHADIQRSLISGLFT